MSPILAIGKAASVMTINASGTVHGGKLGVAVHLMKKMQFQNAQAIKIQNADGPRTFGQCPKAPHRPCCCTKECMMLEGWESK